MSNIVNFDYSSLTEYYKNVSHFVVAFTLPESDYGDPGQFNPQGQLDSTNSYIAVYYNYTDLSGASQSTSFTCKLVNNINISINLASDANPSKAITITRIQGTLDSTLTGYLQNRTWGNDLKKLGLKLTVYGKQVDSPSTPLDPDKIDYTINRYSILLGVAEGEIEGFDKVTIGDSVIREDLTSVAEPLDIDTTVHVGYSTGRNVFDIWNIYDEIDTAGYNLDDPLLVNMFYGARSLPNTYLSTLTAQRKFDLTHATDVSLARLFNGLREHVQITDGTLDYKYSPVTEPIQSYYDLTVATSVFTGTPETMYPSSVKIFFTLPQGLWKIDGADIKKNNISIGIQLIKDSTSAIFNTGYGTLFYPFPSEFINDQSDPDPNYFYKINVEGNVRGNLIFSCTVPLVELKWKPLLEAGTYDTIRIFRVSDDFDSDTDKTWNLSVTKAIFYYNEFAVSYDNTAKLLVSLTANKSRANSVPEIRSILYGLRCRYVPTCRTVSSLPESSESHMQVVSTASGSSYYYEVLGDADYVDFDDLTDTNKYTIGYTSNPIWCLLDLLLSKRYGMGDYLSISDIDLESFFNAALYCDEGITVDGSIIPRFSINLTIDSGMSAGTVITEILKTCRGLLYWNDGIYSVLIDKAENVSLVLNDTQINNYSISQSSPFSRNNSWEYKYLDSTEKYNQFVIPFEDLDNQASTNSVRKKQELLAGITNKHQAIMMSKYLAYREIFNTKSMSFTAPMGFISANIGDRIRIMTKQFLMDTVQSLEISSISAGSFVGGYYYYTVTLRNPVLLDSTYNGEQYNWKLQSIQGTTIVLFPANDASIATIDDTSQVYDAYTSTLYLKSEEQLTSISSGDTISMFVETTDYEDWKITNFIINPAQNTVAISGYNYYDYFSDIEDIDVFVNKLFAGPRPIYPSNRINLDVSAWLTEADFAYEVKINETSGAVLVDAMFNLDIKTAEINKIAKLTIAGAENDKFASDLITVGPTSTIHLPNLSPGTWDFRLIVEAVDGTVSTSDIVSYNLSLNNLSIDPINSVETASVQSAIDAGLNITFVDQIKFEWTDLPKTVSSIQIGFYNNAARDDEFYFRAINRQRLNSTTNKTTISINPIELTGITDRNTRSTYYITITYFDSIGGFYENATLSVVNTAPDAPAAPLTTSSFHKVVESAKVTINMIADDVKNFINSSDDLRDLVGFRIKVPAGDFAHTHEFDIALDGGSYDFTTDILDEPPLESATISLYAYSLDKYGQESVSYLDLGSVTVSLLATAIANEISSTLPSTVGNSLSVNLLRNSGFEE